MSPQPPDPYEEQINAILRQHFEENGWRVIYPNYRTMRERIVRTICGTVLAIVLALALLWAWLFRYQYYRLETTLMRVDRWTGQVQYWIDGKWQP